MRAPKASILWSALLLLLSLAAGGLPASAADVPFPVKVDATVSGMPYWVDGQRFEQPAAFMWMPGSLHVLSTLPQNTALRPGTAYTFAGWHGGGAALGADPNSLVVTADRAVTAYTAAFTITYRLGLRFLRCQRGAVCPSPGVIYVDDEAYPSDADIWFENGAIARLRAEPAPSWSFAGWGAMAGGSGQSRELLVKISGPLNVYPEFVIARRVELLSEPSGLLLSADFNQVLTPATLNWGWNTVHSLAPLSPQTDAAGVRWVFRAWSDGESAVRSYKVPPGGFEAAMTALFVRGTTVSLLTSPPNLKLRVDGRDNWLSYNFAWGIGETHRMEAPARQTDAGGRVYMFRGWSNGVAAGAQDLTLTDADLAGVRVTALYDLLGRVTVTANVPGGAVSADGADCPLPCTLDRPVGSSVRLAAPASAAPQEGVRCDFRGWSDGAPAVRTATFTEDIQVLNASYALLYRLETVSQPAGGARWRSEPASQDGYYDPQTTVALTAQANPGFRFRYFEGDVSGSFSSAFLKMNAPRFVRAVMEEAPKLASAGVRNGAAETPDGVVAPGSMISIFGTGLASAAETGPASPLVQTLAGLTVKVEERLLGLAYVSPTEIHAQLPSGIEPGARTLVIQRAGSPDVKADFEVARNAPGLFEDPVDDRPYAVALHQDGTLISAGAPARRGETITVFGTGFGPCDRQPPDGFALPDSPAFTLADPVEVFAAGILMQPSWAGASHGRVGVQEVRLAIGADLPAATAIPLSVRIGGRDSNTVFVPLE